LAGLKALRCWLDHDRCLAATSCLASILPLSLISMADHHSSAAGKKSKKKGGANFLKPMWDLIKRPKSANDTANPSNLNQGSVSSVSGVHDPVPGNDARTPRPTAARGFIGSISMLLTTQSLFRRQCCLASRYVSPVLHSFPADLADSTHSPDPASLFRSTSPPLSSDPHLLGSTVGQGEIRYTESFRLMRLTSDTRGRQARAPDTCRSEELALSSG